MQRRFAGPHVCFKRGDRRSPRQGWMRDSPSAPSSTNSTKREAQHRQSAREKGAHVQRLQQLMQQLRGATEAYRCEFSLSSQGARTSDSDGPLTFVDYPLTRAFISVNCGRTSWGNPDWLCVRAVPAFRLQRLKSRRRLRPDLAGTGEKSAFQHPRPKNPFQRF